MDFRHRLGGGMRLHFRLRCLYLGLLGTLRPLIGTSAASATTAAATPPPAGALFILGLGSSGGSLFDPALVIAFCGAFRRRKILQPCHKVGAVFRITKHGRCRFSGGRSLLLGGCAGKVHGRARRGNLSELLVFFVACQFQKVGDVEEGIALQADVDESRLHAGQHAGHAAFVNGSCKSVFVFPLEKDFGELIVFHQGHFGFVGCGRYVKFLIHGRSGNYRRGRSGTDRECA